MWNPWKASLLGELYVKTLNLLEEAEKGEFERPDVRAVLRRVQTRVRRQLSKRLRRGEDRKIYRNHARALFSVDPGRRYRCAFRADGSLSRQESRDVGAATFPSATARSVVVCCQDRPGLFASITGVFTALNLDILNARIFTASDGRILDVFRISHHGRLRSCHGRAEMGQVSRRFWTACLDGKIDVADLVASFKPSPLFRRNGRRKSRP